MSAPDSDSEPIARLGPFDLLSFLGRGAMGQVWRAHHREQDVAAAIKIITEEQAQLDGYQRRFRHEVRAVAGLSHPGIVMVFDYGQVPDEVEAATFGELRANNPYLAMELCPKGSLNHLDKRLSFAHVRSILLSLLDSLAHAHARGVIHRDLKPANILLGDDTDWTGVKLTDFGLAFVPERLDGGENSRRGACGTPTYMPPEQLLGKWRDLGPWSDLYSLGCVAYQMVCGQAPFTGNSIVEVARKHLRKPAPPLRPKIAVPEEFEAWVHRLIRKDAHARFRNAADAAWELLLMSTPAEAEDADAANEGAPIGAHADAEDPPRGHESTLVLQHFDNLLASTGPGELLLRTNTDLDENESALPGSALPGSAPPEQRPHDADDLPARAPLPSSWHHLIGRRPSIQLLGAGLGLYGLRHIPLIGRDKERDTLWQQLLDVVHNSNPRAVLLRGAAGTGKSFLAEWLCERAQETGAAITLEATHSPSPGGGEGLARMLARHFRTAGMQREAIVARLRAWFIGRGDDDPYAWDALTELIRPASDDDVAQGQRKVHFGSPAQRHGLIARVLGLLCQERPVVVWLDDLQWASDSLGFMHFLLDSEVTEDLPILVVGTLREDALADESAAQSELAKFALHERVKHLSLGPLAAPIQAELIEKLLYLAPSLARRVADRTRGNPLFAVQLIGDWVDRGVLEVGEAGFVLADGEEALIPDNLFDVWSSRLAEVLSGVPGEQIHALEIAAILGLDIDEGEWRAALDLAGAAFPHEVVHELLSHRLFEDTDTGVRFVHGMLRESLERRAKEGARLIEHNRACARMLTERYDAEPRLAERLGRHLLAARAYLDALSPLLEGAKARGNAAEIDAALMLLDMRLEAIEALELPETCAPRVENWAVLSFALTLHGDNAGADVMSQRAVDVAEKLDDPGLLARCLVRRAQCLQHQNRLALSTALLERAQQLAPQASCGDELLMKIGELSAGTLRMQGRIDEAIERFQAARQIAVECDDVIVQVALSRELGSCERRRGNLAKAEAMLREALSLCERMGLQLRIGDTLLSLADVVRLRGDLDEAEELYRQAYRHGRVVRPGVSTVAQLNLALLYVQRERYEATRTLLEKLRATLARAEHSRMQLYADAISLPCLAFEGSWALFDPKFDHVLETVERHDIVDDDIAICLEQAASLAADAGRFEPAKRALEVALELWEKSGNDERARTTRRQRDRIAALKK